MTDAESSGSSSWLHVGNLAELEHDDDHLMFRRTLLETPSGFAIFDVHKNLFKAPEHMWCRLTDETEAREVVFAVGFVKVEDKSVARNTSDGPGKELSMLIRKLCAHRNDLIVQDDQLKVVIETNLKVKCSVDVDYFGDLIWGLKYVMHEFIPQEKENLTDGYYLPLCKGFQNAFKKNKLDFSQVQQMDRNFVYMLGYVEQLGLNQKILLNMFRRFFDHLFHEIGEIIKDDGIYRCVLKNILMGNVEFPDIQCNHDLPEEIFQRVRGSVSRREHLWAVKVLKYLDTFDEQRSYALDYLNLKLVGSEKDPMIQANLETIQAELQRLEPEEGILDDWLVAIMKKDLETRRGDVGEDGKNGLHVADKVVLHNCPDVLDTQVDLTTLVKADSMDGVRGEDGLLHVEKGKALHVDETSPQLDKIVPQVEEEIAAKQVEEETVPQVEETITKVEEETTRHVVSKGDALDGDGNIPKGSGLSKLFSFPLLGMSIGCGIIIMAMVLSSKTTELKSKKTTC